VHAVPQGADGGHIDTPLPAELTFSGIAQGSTWNGSDCASYCHGAAITDPGGNAKRPLWTKVDGTQKQCTSCHGNPPAAPHPNDPDCTKCHASGGTGGTFTNGALHIDGTLQVTSVHPPGYNAREMHGSASCATAGCHGTALTGGNSGGPSCNNCHNGWQTNCTFCHGTSGLGAPPQGALGQTVATDRHVGAHTKHLGATGTHAAWTCTYCHTQPSSALTPKHVDGAGAVVQAEVVFSTLNPGSSYNLTATTCAASYCHGTGLATKATPAWTSTAPLACVDSCHGGSPNYTGMSSEHRRGDHKKPCVSCHKSVVSSNTTILDVSLHVNGARNVLFTTGTYNTTAKSCTGTGGGCHGNGTKSGWS
jgi:predicted CxxxxCH...CXXCH cytochrome family protein